MPNENKNKKLLGAFYNTFRPFTTLFIQKNPFSEYRNTRKEYLTSGAT